MAGFAVDAVVLNQEELPLYLFGMDSTKLKRLCYVTPRTKDDPTEIQRILNHGRARSIGEYIKKPGGVLPNAIVVSLMNDVTVATTANPKVVTLHFPEESGRYAYVLDGQHRLAGFDHSQGVAFDLPVVAFHNIDDNLRGKIFADINSKQQAVTDVHVLSLYYQIGGLPQEDAQSMDVVVKLATDQDSPLAGHVKMRDDERGRWVRNTFLKQHIAPWVQSGGPLFNKTPLEQARIIKSYLGAISRVWPQAWGNNKKYLLTMPFGLEIMLGLLDAAMRRCDLNAGRQYSVEAFVSQLQPLVGAKIKVSNEEIEVDWVRGGVLGKLSSSTFRALIRRQLLDVLRRADDEP